MNVNRPMVPLLVALSGVVLLAGCTRSAALPTEGGSAVSESAVATTSAPPGLRMEMLPFPEPAAGGLPAAQQRALQAALDQVTQPEAAGVIRGVTVAVVTPSGSWAGVTGTDGDGVPLVPEAMADIASITKTVSAAQVLSLARAGLIDLDVPASTYLEHPLLSRGPTVRQLLSHTSGVPEHTTDTFFTAVLADPGRTWTPPDALAYATGPAADPGRLVLDYSNSNYLLLGLIIERVTGLSYAEAVRRDVLADLGGRMVAQTGEAPSPPLAAPDRTDGAVPDGQYLPNRALASAAGAAGGIAADAPTLATWGYRLYGGLVLPREQTVQLATPVAAGYGLGTMIVPGSAEQGPLVGHLGGINGYATALAVDPTRRVSVAVLAVGTGGPPLDDLIGHILTTLTT